MELILTSDIINIDIENHDELINLNIDDIIFTEQYRPNPEFHGEYQIILKTDVKDKSDLYSAADQLSEIAIILNRLITYIIGSR